jgi:hypothetical protein
MAIVQKRKPPAEAQSIIGKALRDLWGRPDPHDVLGGAINLSQPLPVYNLRLRS